MPPVIDQLICDTATRRALGSTNKAIRVWTTKDAYGVGPFMTLYDKLP